MRELPPETQAKLDLAIDRFVTSTGVSRTQAMQFGKSVAQALEDYMLAPPTEADFEVASREIAQAPRFTVERIRIGGELGNARWVIKEDGHVLAIIVREPEEQNARRLALGALVLETADAAERGKGSD